MAMEEENRALLKDADRLRKWKDRLLHDNQVLREESKRVKEKLEAVEKNLKQEVKEKKQLKESYQKVWQEKAALLEKQAVSGKFSTGRFPDASYCRVPPNSRSKYC